jgi:hypothetical protein
VPTQVATSPNALYGYKFFVTQGEGIHIKPCVCVNRTCMHILSGQLASDVQQDKRRTWQASQAQTCIVPPWGPRQARSNSQHETTRHQQGWMACLCTSTQSGCQDASALHMQWPPQVHSHPPEGCGKHALHTDQGQSAQPSSVSTCGLIHAQCPCMAAARHMMSEKADMRLSHRACFRGSLLLRQQLCACSSIFGPSRSER